jgi:hypothetical protein
MPKSVRNDSCGGGKGAQDVPLTNSISDFLLIVCGQSMCELRCDSTVVDEYQEKTYLDIFIVLVVNDVNGLLNIAEHQIAMAVICLIGG